MPVLEPERRKNHIDMIDPDHGLLPIAVDCLRYQENERPSSEELCQRLADLKETREYRESVELGERVQNDIAQLERQVKEMQVREAATVQQLQELRDEYQLLQKRYQHLESEIQSKDSQIKQKDERIQTLCKQFEEQEHITAESQQSLQIQVEQLQQQSGQISSQLPPPIPPRTLIRGRQLRKPWQTQSLIVRPSIQLQKSHPPLVELQWRDGGKALCKMNRGAATVDGNVAYFMDYDGRTCSYVSSTQRWSELPKCPHWYGSLAVIRGLLTAIGGGKLGDPDNKLLSMNSKAQMWVEHFPPMPTKRSHTAAVSTEQHLIVAGGVSDRSTLEIVEVMDFQTLAIVWSTAASLPHPCSWASATICGDQQYILGGLGSPEDDPLKSVLTCSLTKLLQSCSKTSPNPVWHSTTDVPVYQSTSATVNGELVAVGGKDAKDKTTSAIHKYDPTTDSWNVISNMPTARMCCLVAVLPTNEMMVVGGNTTIYSITDKVEIAN